ncbi:hypothetical protein QBC41DRAFT_386419 [Cercophora samala]|uniref:Uncharacterized protein n=1 Tax=Cercophora samala TaxID=330535 RepID=A0AA39ZHU8_9PEZI|nr:hypothetical protein QBC41DRAFT_386419 [Cercophora samala]
MTLSSTSGSGNFEGLRHHWAFAMLFEPGQYIDQRSDEEIAQSVRNGWDPPLGWKPKEPSSSPNTDYTSNSKDESLSTKPFTRTSIRADKGDSPRPVIEHHTPSTEVSPNPDDVFGPSYACSTKTQQRNSRLYDWEDRKDGKDSLRVFLKTAADFDKYTADRKQPRRLLQCRTHKFNPDAHLEICLETKRESIIRQKKHSFQYQQHYGRKEGSSHDQTHSDQDYHTGYLKEGRSEKKEKADEVGRSDTRVLDGEKFTWWW